MLYMAVHLGSLLSSATKRAAVLNSGREEVRRGMCSLSYQSTMSKKRNREGESRKGVKGRDCGRKEGSGYELPKQTDKTGRMQGGHSP